MPLVPGLGRQVGIFTGSLADEAGFLDIVGEGLLTIDVLAVGQRQVGRDRVGLLGY